MVVEFKCPPMSDQPSLWGPPTTGDGLPNLRGYFDFVEHLDKFPATRVGKICDFTLSGQRFMEQKGKGKMGKAGGKGKAMPVINPATKDDEGFSLVDSRPMPTKSAGRGRGGAANRNKGRGKGLQQNYQEGILGQKQKPFYNQNQNATKGKGKGGKGGNQRRGLPSFKEWSVETKTEWELKQEIMLHSLSKLQLDSREVKYEDVLWAGKLHTFGRQCDRITTKTSVPVKRFQDLQFFAVSTSEDPYLPQFLTEDPEVTVIATDEVLAVLVAAARSIYSWDVVVTKLQGKLIFDTRNGSQVNWLSVNETAQDPPNNDDKESINSPLKLSQEASCINQNFSQMVLDNSPPEEMGKPNPFEDDDSLAASGAYRYRKVELPGNSKASDEWEKSPCTIIIRTEVNCKLHDAKNGRGYVSVKALNEYDPKPNYAWRNHLESQRGACLATEVKNNAFKLGRWTAQAILGGCDTMKIGYASRASTTDNSNHVVLGVQTHMTDGFAEQIGLTRNNMFGILRTIIDLVMKWDDGKYLILKDPTKSVLRVYEVPWDSFDEEEEDDDEEEEDQELDEDGNIAPLQPQGMGR